MDDKLKRLRELLDEVLTLTFFELYGCTRAEYFDDPRPHYGAGTGDLSDPQMGELK